MTGIAAGLALSRQGCLHLFDRELSDVACLEQIRNDVCYHRLPVKIVAVGGGYAFGALGYTHHGVEDLGILRCLPNLTVVAPGDAVEAAAATAALATHEGPAYLRLGKSGEAQVHAAGSLDFRQPESQFKFAPAKI